MENTWESFWAWSGGIAFLVFFAWMIFGGMFEDQSAYDAAHTISVDCRNPREVNSPYCNGTFEIEARDQEGIENNYYQNTVR